MFQHFDPATRSRPDRRYAATLSLSVAVHLVALAGLLHLSSQSALRVAPMRDQAAEVLEWSLTLPPPEASPPEQATNAQQSDDVPSEVVAPTTAEPAQAEVLEPPVEIPPIEAALALHGREPVPLPTEREMEGRGAGALLLDSIAVSPTALAAFPFLLEGSEPVRLPRLRNRDFILELLSRLYPRRLEISRIAGEATLRFTIDARGDVDVASIRLIAADREEFAIAALKAVERFRFWPARYRNQAVPIAIEMPIRWVPGY